jgi:hypothetical protein
LFDPPSSRQGRRRRARRLIAALAAAIGTAAYSSSPEEPDHPRPVFNEAITVGERTIYVDDKLLPPLESKFRRANRDLAVLVGGVVRETVETPPPSVSESTLHLVWIDPDLAGPEAVAAGALELARAFARFPISDAIWIARVSSKGIFYEENLAATAASTSLYRTAEEREDDTQDSFGWDTDLERRQLALDRLTVELSERFAGRGGAVWIVVDGWPLALSEITALHEPLVGNAHPNSSRGILERTARLLAAFDWIAFPVGARRELATEARGKLSRPHETMETTDEMARQSPINSREWKGEWYYRLFSRRKRRQEAIPLKNRMRALDASLDPRLQPLSFLAAPTSGALVAEQFGIEDRAARVRNRRQIVVREPESPPGPLRRLDVVWIGGDGRSLPAPKWVRFGAPPELAVARLRALAAGLLDAATGRLVRLHAREPGGQPPELCFSNLRSGDRWLRAARWNAETAIAEVGAPVEVEQYARPCVRLSSVPAPSDFVLIEDLVSGEWGAIVP